VAQVLWSAAVESSKSLQHTMQHTATHCNALQRIATHCNTPQHTTTYYNTLQNTATIAAGAGMLQQDHLILKNKVPSHCISNILQHTAITLQHTATHCSALQHTAAHCNTQQRTATHCNKVQQVS